MFLFDCLSGWLPGCLSVCLFAWLPVCLSACLFAYLLGCLSRLSARLCVLSASACLDGNLSDSLAVWVSACQPVFLPACLCVCVCLPTCMSVSACLYLLVCLSVSALYYRCWYLVYLDVARFEDSRYLMPYPSSPSPPPPPHPPPLCLCSPHGFRLSLVSRALVSPKWYTMVCRSFLSPFDRYFRRAKPTRALSAWQHRVSGLQ